MRIFDPHVHMYARTTDDYERMALAGVEAIVEPAFWLGEPRKHPGTFFDYFDHLVGFERSRAARYGIQQWSTIAMNPREANNRELSRAVLKELPRWLDRKEVVAVGEIGFDLITEAEEEVFRAQVDLARAHKLPILIHSPHANKKKGIEKMIAILRDMKTDMDRVLMDHNVEDTTAISLAAGCWAGHTVYPVTKLTPERAANIVEKHGWEKMMFNSAADWGHSDPLMVPKTVLELKRRGHPREKIQKLVWDNPWAFFSKSGRMS